MLTITLANNKQYEVLPDTAVYPALNAASRGRMEIHMSEDTMTMEDLEKIFSDEALTAEIVLERDDELGAFRTLYKNFIVVSSLGKKRITKTDYTTAQTTEEVHLVVELEQLTYLEQQLAALQSK